MVNSNLKYGLVFLVYLMAQIGLAQNHLISEVSMNKSSVFVGEPMEVSVSVYSSTWFTKGVDPGNIKVNGAYTVYFRGVSLSKKIQGKTYAGVEMIFNVFPYKDEDIIFPAVEFKVETPDDGDYKGVSRVIRTKARTIKVKPIPKGYDKTNWIVSTSVRVQQQWSAKHDKIKVGDVLERIIIRRIENTVSGLIPPLTWDSIIGVSIYPSVSSVENIKTKTRINAVRTDGLKYLFEKEGVVVLPKIEIKWWNPQQKKLYKYSLEELTINVQPNPDLSMLESVRDSLQLAAIENAAGEDKKAVTIFGLSIKRFLFGLFTLILLSYLLIIVSIKLRGKLKKRRANYLKSELYFFKQFINSAKRDAFSDVLPKLYFWLDQLVLEEPTLAYFIKNYGTKDLRKEAEQFINLSAKDHLSIDKSLWIAARTNYFKTYKHSVKDNNWVNP